MSRAWKWLAGGVIAVVLGWSAWWVLGARGQEAGLETWLDAQQARGWQAEAGSIAVSGYPLDFRIDVEDLALADPNTGWAWSAPGWIAESRAYSPTRVAVSWPTEQVISTPEGRATVTSVRLASLVDLRPGQSMELREAATEMDNLRIQGANGWEARAAAVRMNVAERPEDLGPVHAYDIRLTAQTLKLPQQIVEQIDPTGWLRPSIDQLTVLGHAAFDDPLDRLTVEQGRMALRAATIREAGFQWGDMRLVIKGAFEVDDAGYPVGDVRIEAEEWRQMIRLAVSSDVIDRGTAQQVTRAVEFVTALTGSGDKLSLSLGLSGGKLRIGPFAIADAPRVAPPR
ncbi:MAG: DUF2125 domain-containing protein [Pseudomonadota bacterium]